jgi:hypothetical protein
MRTTPSASLEGDWTHVSERNPCPICKSASRCRRHTGDAFAACTREPSDWPLTSGAWLHRVQGLVEIAS